MKNYLTSEEIINNFLNDNENNLDTQVFILQSEYLKVIHSSNNTNVVLIVKDDHSRYEELYSKSTGFELPEKLKGVEDSNLYRINLSNYPKDWTVENLINYLTKSEKLNKFTI